MSYLGTKKGICSFCPGNILDELFGNPVPDKAVFWRKSQNIFFAFSLLPVLEDIFFYFTGHRQSRLLNKISAIPSAAIY